MNSSNRSQTAVDRGTSPTGVAGPVRLVGTQPVLPGPLARSAWWTVPIPAERWAALRIGVGLTLLLDVVLLYWPLRRVFFGPGSLGGPEVFADRLTWPLWNWTLFSFLPTSGAGSSAAVDALLVVWAAAALGLAVGCCTRLSAAVAWSLTLSVMNVNYFLHNGGDRLRLFALFYLLLTPAGAAWSVDAWWGRRRGRVSAGPAVMPPWPVRLMTIQLAAVYFFSAVLKLKGDTWHSGEALWLVMTNVAWTRWSFADFPLAAWMTTSLTWITLVWELAFPVLLCSRRTRWAALTVGAVFHLCTGLLLKLGLFPLYACCWYVPLLPWERLAELVGRLEVSAGWRWWARPSRLGQSLAAS